MAFLIRTIDYTSSGREIIRDRKVEAARLTIGRASENDIHLPDLAVDQIHLQISQRGDGMLFAETVSGLGFGVDGRTELRSEIDPAVGAEITMGSSLLVVSQEGDGPVQITIKQVEKDASAGDQLQRFALASALPGKRVFAWIGSLAIVVLLLSIPIISHLTRDVVENDPDNLDQGQVVLDSAWSTGELSLAHHDLEENCEACHVTPFQSVQDETCLTCHGELGDHAAMPRLKQGMAPLSQGDAIQWSIAETLGKEGPLGCVSCHTEHEGPVKQAAATEQFCADCHNELDTRLSDVDFHNAADFGEKHPQFRPKFYTAYYDEKPLRVSLDSKVDEKSGLVFPHDIHMDRDGGAARMAISLGQYGAPLECSNCHEEQADGIGFAPVVMEDACESCHSLVFDRAGPNFRSLRHGDIDDLMADLASMNSGPSRSVASPRNRPGQFARGGRYYSNFGRPMSNYIAVNQALGRNGVCTECHIPTTTQGRRDLVPVNLPDRFLFGGHFSHAAHGGEVAQCSDCHAADSSSSASDLLIPDLNSCRDCHLGETATKTEKIVPSGCAMCHSYHKPTLPWKPEGHPDNSGENGNNDVAMDMSAVRR